jgi:HD-GYP domain-containing protein (c-di-GMP phosphodiesterase class II)
LIATRLARLARFSTDEVAATYYVSLLALVGCVADSHELGRWFGDDTAIRARSYAVDRAGLPMLRFLVANVGSGQPPMARLSLLGGFATRGMREVAQSMSAHCQTTGDIAGRLGVGEQVARALPQALERWDGKGGPNGIHGTEIERSMRVVQIANESEVFHRLSGQDAVVAMLRERRSGQFDPSLVDGALEHLESLFDGIDDADAWSTVIAGCAPLDREMTNDELQTALETLADYADLKSPWFLGHSRAVAMLTAEAARRAGLPGSQVALAEHAGLVCRLGVIGVSSATWDKRGSLTSIERERVRTVPYLTERVLRRQRRLAEIGSLAAMFHERMDGSGYPRGVNGTAIPPAARILAGAEVYQALREERPHRPALSADDAARVIRDAVTSGELDPAAADAVLGAAGHRTRKRPTNVAGLSGREIEILGLLVRGRSNREIAAQLTLSHKTVSSHVEHIYTKIGASSRGAAAMFAMHHGLVDPAQDADTGDL